MWFLAALGCSQAMFAAFWSLERQSPLSIDWLGPVWMAGVAMVIMRSQPVYSVVFASRASLSSRRFAYEWLDVGPVELTWWLNIELSDAIWVALALGLVVEWRGELGAIRSTVYWANFVVSISCIVGIVPTLPPLARAGLIALPLVLHTERSFFLGARRTLRARGVERIGRYTRALERLRQGIAKAMQRFLKGRVAS